MSGASAITLPRSVAAWLASSVSTSPAKPSVLPDTLAIVRVPLLLAVPVMTICWPTAKPSAAQLPPSLRTMVSLAEATWSKLTLPSAA